MAPNSHYHSFQRALLRKYVAQSMLVVVLLLGAMDSSSFNKSPFFDNGYKIDSLQALLLAVTDTSRVNLLNELGKKYWVSQPDTARLYAHQALDQSRKIHFQKGEAEAFRIIGWSYGDNYALARTYLMQAIRIFEQIGEDAGLAAALNNLGVIETGNSYFTEGLQALERSLVIFRRLGNQEGEGSVLNYIGINYQQQGYYDKAIEYCLQGIQIRRKIQDHPGIAHSLNNMGNMYLAADKLDAALDYYHQGMAYAQARGLPSLEYSLLLLGQTYNRLGKSDTALYFLNRSLAINPNSAAALNTMGATHLARQSYKASLNYLLKSLLLLEKNHTRSTLYLNVLNNISNVHAAQQHYQEGLSYAHQSFDIARRIGARKEAKAAAQTLSEIYAGLHDFARAYEYQQLYIVLKDSITSEDYTRRLAALEANLELAKKQAQIESLTREQQLQQQELKRQATLRNIFIAGLCFTLVLGVVIFRNIGLKRKAEGLQKEQLESDLALERMEKQQKEAAFQSRMAELEMMALRAQMNPHFIFNSLNSINRFILKNESEAASDFLTKFSRLIRLILQNSQCKTVSLANELEALRLYVEMEALRFEGHFEYHIKADPNIEMQEVEVSPLIIQPYVENAIWHGLMHKQDKGHLEIELHRQNATLYCQVTDDGIGRRRAIELNSKSASKKKSLGMQITAHRLELLNQVHTRQTRVEITDLVDAAGEACGTRVVLQIPI